MPRSAWFFIKGQGVLCVCHVLRVLFNPSVVHLTPLPSVPSITLTLTLTHSHSHSHTGTWCEASISAHLKARDMGLEDTPASYSGIQLHVITAHCHAPSCISQVRHAGEVVLCFFVSIVVVITIVLDGLAHRGSRTFCHRMLGLRAGIVQCRHRAAHLPCARHLWQLD